MTFLILAGVCLIALALVPELMAALAEIITGCSVCLVLYLAVRFLLL